MLKFNKTLYFAVCAFALMCPASAKQAKPETHDKDCAVSGMIMSREGGDDVKAGADQMTMFYLGRMSVRNPRELGDRSALFKAAKGHEKIWFFDTGIKCLDEMKAYSGMNVPE